jgi:hypothetical protein
MSQNILARINSPLLPPELRPHLQTRSQLFLILLKASDAFVIRRLFLTTDARIFFQWSLMEFRELDLFAVDKLSYASSRATIGGMREISFAGILSLYLDASQTFCSV